MANGMIKKGGFVYDTLFDSHSANVTTGDKALSGNADDYTMLIAAVFVPNSDGSYACLHWAIPHFQIASGNTFEVLNPASGSLSWYVRFTLKFSGTTMTVINSAKAGYTTAGLAVYGVKIAA